MSCSISKCKCVCINVDQKPIIDDLISSQLKLSTQISTLKEELEKLNLEKKILNNKIDDIQEDIQMKNAFVISISEDIYARKYILKQQQQ